MKPTVPEVLPVANELYEYSCVGGCWHVVLDDGNVEDSHVQACVDDIKKYGCDCGGDACLRLASLLPQMSRTQRYKLYRTLTR